MTNPRTTYKLESNKFPQRTTYTSILTPTCLSSLVLVQHVHLNIGLTLNAATLHLGLPSQCRETKPRMAHSQRCNSDENHDTLKRNKLALNPHHRTAPTAQQLRNTVYTPNKYRDIGDDNSTEKASKATTLPEVNRIRRELTGASVRADSVLCSKKTEDSEYDDLPDLDTTKD